MAKIFIASSEVRGTENFPVAEHSYWVKDEDGDVTTTDDQTISSLDGKGSDVRGVLFRAVSGSGSRHGPAPVRNRIRT